MSAEKETEILEELKNNNYFLLKDNGAKRKILDDLAGKYGVEAVWIKDVIINGFGKEGRRINNEKILNALGLINEQDLVIDRHKDDPAEGVIIAKTQNRKIYYVSSAPGQAGIGLMKAVDSVENAKSDFAVVFVNNGNDGPISDDDFVKIRNTLTKLGVEAVGVHSAGISHAIKIDFCSKRESTKPFAELKITELSKGFIKDADHHLRLSASLIKRFISSLSAKRFLILTGLAGSGKTKLAQAFSRWITPDPGWIDETDHSKGKKPNLHAVIVPVGADWTGCDNVLGYADGLREKAYVSTPALDVILSATKPEHKSIPHFLILDEMNLSHVERYFSAILSAIESSDPIPLHNGDGLMAGDTEVKQSQILPPNLFIIGTVNVDETTYMFSPKVLDRANVIEFRIDDEDFSNFLDDPKPVLLEKLDGQGSAFGESLVAAASDKSRAVPDKVKTQFKEEMMLFFKLLQQHQAEFGYRTSYEAARFVHFYKELGGYSNDDDSYFNDAMDAVVVQKFLPKLHGSRTKLEGLLWALSYACGADRGALTPKDFTTACLAAGSTDDEAKSPEAVKKALGGEKARYPLSFDKVQRMYAKLIRDQFVTFSEA
jgi:energy-coupling factor transporter ATP-binding protein EcfA2